MEDFEVDGATLLGLVQAQNAVDTLDEAERIISWIDMSPSVASTAQHRMVRCRLVDPEDD
jgi:hypothetical protein